MSYPEFKSRSLRAVSTPPQEVKNNTNDKLTDIWDSVLPRARRAFLVD